MVAATVTSKGQITIPVSVREALGLKSGDRVEFTPADDGFVMVAAPRRSVTELKGMIRKPERPVSIEEMNEAIKERGSRM